jgi:hypothetical protein
MRRAVMKLLKEWSEALIAEKSSWAKSFRNVYPENENACKMRHNNAWLR